MGINRLRESGKFHIDAFAVISEESMKPLCKKYDIDYCFYKNSPLGEKKNFGLTESFKKSWDYMIELGSDDLLKDELLVSYEPWFGKRPILSTDHFFFLDSISGQARRMKSSSLYGIGRAFERKALEKATEGVRFLAYDDLITTEGEVNKGKIAFFSKASAMSMERGGQGQIISEATHKMWVDEQERGMDNASTFMLARRGMLGKIVPSEKAVAIDIKSQVNIWPYNGEAGSEADIMEVMEGLSQAEQNALFDLIRKQKVETACLG